MHTKLTKVKPRVARDYAQSLTCPELVVQIVMVFGTDTSTKGDLST